MPIYSNIGGGSKQIASLYINNNGSNKALNNAYGNINGSKKEIFSIETIYTWYKYVSYISSTNTSYADYTYTSGAGATLQLKPTPSTTYFTKVNSTTYTITFYGDLGYSNSTGKFSPSSPLSCTYDTNNPWTKEWMKNELALYP